MKRILLYLYCCRVLMVAFSLRTIKDRVFMGMNLKNDFFQSLNDPKSKKDAILQSLKTSQNNFMYRKPNYPINQYNAKGIWRVIYAPHIVVLSKIFFTTFNVFYTFGSDNIIISNVKYSSPIFGQGWLNTLGDVRFQNNNTTCEIIWRRIWWDWCNNEPSKVNEEEKHLLPQLIQTIGLIAFIKSASVFPVDYLDNDFCVFTFPLSNTVIGSKRVDDLITTTN
mmetsp:Transcript_20172/g.27795  ORF Transcript_20172/g.27795 Transcript_20172/m.27795 type:complete len:223 (+) Transcript_20172:2-670(+)